MIGPLLQRRFRGTRGFNVIPLIVMFIGNDRATVQVHCTYRGSEPLNSLYIAHVSNARVVFPVPARPYRHTQVTKLADL